MLNLGSLSLRCRAMRKPRNDVVALGRRPGSVWFYLPVSVVGVGMAVWSLLCIAGAVSGVVAYHRCAEAAQRQAVLWDEVILVRELVAPGRGVSGSGGVEGASFAELGQRMLRACRLECGAREVAGLGVPDSLVRLVGRDEYGLGEFMARGAGSEIRKERSGVGDRMSSYEEEFSRRVVSLEWWVFEGLAVAFVASVLAGAALLRAALIKGEVGRGVAAAAELKQKMLSDFGHVSRNPLAAIYGYAWELSSVDDPDVALAASRILGMSEHLRLLLDRAVAGTLDGVESGVSGRSVSSGSGSQCVLAGCRVLVVDDVADHRMLISRVLERAGATAEAAENGAQAVALAGCGERFDCILMDVEMPRMNGLDAVRAMRRVGVGVPIVAITANSSPSDRSKCLGAGYTDYWEKPVRPRALVDGVLLWVSGRDRHRDAGTTEVGSCDGELSAVHTRDGLCDSQA